MKIIIFLEHHITNIATDYYVYSSIVYIRSIRDFFFFSTKNTIFRPFFLFSYTSTVVAQRLVWKDEYWIEASWIGS